MAARDTEIIDVPHPDRPQDRIVRVTTAGDSTIYVSNQAPVVEESGDTTVLSDVGTIKSMSVQATGPNATIQMITNEGDPNLRIVRQRNGSVVVTSEG